MRGFTMIEAMVALVLLSFSALALSEGLLASHRMQKESGRWMRAVTLAEEAIERARARAGSGVDVIGPYERRWSSSAAGPALRRLEAEVRWESHSFALQTLVND